MTNEVGTRRGRAQQSTEGPDPAALAHSSSQASAAHDWRVEAFVESAPNPGWSLRVTHIPTGTTRTATGKGRGWSQAGRDVRDEIAEALGLDA